MRRWLFAAFALVVTAAPAAARTWVVDWAGSGDVTTIQAALDSVQIASGTDTVVVLPGHYAERDTIWKVEDYYRAPAAVVICPGGPEFTSLMSLSFPCPPALDEWYAFHPVWTFRGLEILEGITLEGHGQDNIALESCAFRGPLVGHGSGRMLPAFVDCDFYAPVSLTDYNSMDHPVTRSRFHHAPLTTTRYASPVVYQDCTFEGFGDDTLVSTTSGTDMYFSGCTFDGGRVGLWMPGGPDNAITNCRFLRLGMGIKFWNEGGGVNGVPIRGCRFEDCEQAVANAGSAIYMAADTLRRCGDRAIVLGRYADLTNLLVQGVQGVAVDRSLGLPDDSGMLGMRGCTFQDVDSVVVRTRFEPAPDRFLEIYITGNRFERCGGGVRIEASDVGLSENVVLGCTGDGFSVAFRPRGDTYDGYAGSSGSFTRNTCALNGGHGISVTARDSTTWYAPLDLSRNLVARNGATGIQVGDGVVCALASNDAWQNEGGAYLGITPDASNLELDPLFCGLAAGDLTVYVHSPAAPNTSTGPIGALGVGCDESRLGVPPSTSPAIAFAARPIPARGSVEFALPVLGGSARIEVLDAQGRRVWSASLERGATIVRWQGERDGGGAAEPGVYWARLVGAVPPQARRFIWLR